MDRYYSLQLSIRSVVASPPSCIALHSKRSVHTAIRTYLSVALSGKPVGLGRSAFARRHHCRVQSHALSGEKKNRVSFILSNPDDKVAEAMLFTRAHLEEGLERSAEQAVAYRIGCLCPLDLHALDLSDVALHQFLL